jgi:hypothetical protein
MEGFSFVMPVTDLNRPNAGKEVDDDDDDDVMPILNIIGPYKIQMLLREQFFKLQL